MRGVRGVLLDAGGVLVAPAGGRWNPRFDFEVVVARHVPEVDLGRLPTAIAAGEAWLSSRPAPHPRDGYHRVVLAALGVPEPTDALLDELDGPAPGPVFEAFPEVDAALERLRRAGLRLAVVTDSSGTSTSKRRQLAEVGLDQHFAAIVVSDELGCTKPDPRMFDTASTALGLRREECLFVDDDPDLVRAAIAFGYRGAALVRTGAAPADVPSFPSLDRLCVHLGLE